MSEKAIFKFNSLKSVRPVAWLSLAILAVGAFGNSVQAQWLNETFEQYAVTSPESQPTVGSSPFLQLSSVATTVINSAVGKQLRYSKLTATATGNQLQYSFSLNNGTDRPKGYYSFKITQNTVPSPLVASSDFFIRLGSNDNTVMNSANTAYIDVRFRAGTPCTFSVRSGANTQSVITSVSATAQHTVQVWYNSEATGMSYTDPSGNSQTLAANSYVCYVNRVLANPTAAGSTMLSSVTPAGATATLSSIGKIAFGTSSSSAVDFLVDDIYAADSAPVSEVGITSATTATAQAGYPFSYTIRSSGVTSPSYSASPLPSGLSVDSSTGVISGALATTATSTTIGLTANGTGGPATANLALTVTPAATVVPSITSAATASGNLTRAFSYQITTATTSPSSTPTSYAIATGTLPAGLALNTTTGAITGTPTELTPDGGTQITYTATNPFGTSNAQTLTITINPAPVFTWNNTGTAWTTGTSWTNGVAPANSATTDIAAFGNLGASATSVDVGTGRSIGGIVFNSGAYAYTWTGTDITVGGTSGITNNSTAIQTFGNKILNTGANPTWTSVSGGAMVFSGGIDLGTTAVNRTVTFAGAGNVTVSGTIANGGTATAGNVTFSSTGTNLLSGNNTYGGATTINAGSTLKIETDNALGSASGRTVVSS